MDNRTLAANSNDEIHVACVIPMGTRITQWYKDGELLNISNDDRIRTEMINYLSLLRLIITDIKSSDSGYYQCEASNGERSSLSGYFSVISKLKILISITLICYNT